MKFINTYFIGSYKANYQITELVDSGGMSKIYRAFCLQTSKIVVIKILNFKKTESPLEIKKKLAYEALISTKLSHPGICSILDFASDYDGNYGLVLENLSGNNLAIILQKIKKPFTLKEAMTIIFEITSALEHAHNPDDSKIKKIIHRDIKPSNIFITDELNIKLLDFGISTYIDDELHTNRKNDGFTKCYTPPDLWINESKYNLEGYNETHDIYCLGLIFYELLTKRKAFETMQENINGDIKCLSQFGFSDQPLINLFKKWSSKAPDERFKNIQELIDALSNLKTNYNSISTSEALQHVTDYTEIDETLFESNDTGNVAIVELAILNILNSISYKLNSLIIKNEIENKINKLARITNQRLFFAGHVNYATFNSKILNLLKIDDSKFNFNDKSIDETIMTFNKLLTKAEAYEVYSSIYKTLQKTNSFSIHKYLYSIRKNLELDPYSCDEEKNCEGYQESIAGAIYARINFNNNENARININNKIRFHKLPNEEFYIEILKFYISYDEAILNKATETEKQIISYTLSRFAYADHQIDSIEKKIICELNKKLKLNSLNYELILNKDKKMLFESLDIGFRSFALCQVFTLLIKKVTISPKELEIQNELFQIYIESTKNSELRSDDYFVFAEFVLEFWEQLKTNKNLVTMIYTIQSSLIPNFETVLSDLNQIRSILLNKKEKSFETLLEINKIIICGDTSTAEDLLQEFYELLEGESPKQEIIYNQEIVKTNKSIPLFSNSIPIELFYLYHREKYCSIKESKLSRFISKLDKLENISIRTVDDSHSRILNWKIPYFIYKYGLKDTNTFNSTEFYKILNDLKIDNNNIRFAQRMILCNYKKDVS